MERLTKRNEKGLAVLAFKCPDECEHSTCSIEEGYQCQHQCEGDIIEKLATYEEFEEIFREKMASVACEFLSDKEEFGKWLDRNKWITKKCDEYARAEEQGLLLRLPCKVGDTVYCIYERYTKCSENEQEFDEYSCQGCECLECDSHKELYVQSQKAYSLDWIVSNLRRFGKTVFLTQAEAEQKLKEMESD